MYKAITITQFMNYLSIMMESMPFGMIWELKASVVRKETHDGWCSIIQTMNFNGHLEFLENYISLVNILVSLIHE